MMPGIWVVLVPVTPLPAAICAGELRTAERADLLAGTEGYYDERIVCHLRDPLRRCWLCAWPDGPSVVAATPVADAVAVTSLRPAGRAALAPLRPSTLRRYWPVGHRLPSRSARPDPPVYRSRS